MCSHSRLPMVPNVSFNPLPERSGAITDVGSMRSHLLPSNQISSGVGVALPENPIVREAVVCQLFKSPKRAAFAEHRTAIVFSRLPVRPAFLPMFLWIKYRHFWHGNQGYPIWGGVWSR
jgi:hypothetical protein